MRRPEAPADRSIPDLTRREILGGIGAAALTAGAAKAVDNVLLGYGVLTGSNLVSQDLRGRVLERFEPVPATVTLDGFHVTIDRDTVVVDAAGTTRRFPTGDTAAAEATDSDLGLDGALSGVTADLRALAAGEVAFAFSRTAPFFDRVRTATPRPHTVGALRGDGLGTPSPPLVGQFADANPAATADLVEGLAAGFRRHSHYDLSRYIAGSVEDNLLMGMGDLRAPFRSPTDFRALLDGDDSGLFCYEFTRRSIEAFHAVAPGAQTAPVVGVAVFDSRHKHVYTGLASVVRENGDVVVPMTFLDYTHSTLYDDLEVRRLLGDGIEAFDDRHLATTIYWDP